MGKISYEQKKFKEARELIKEYYIEKNDCYAYYELAKCSCIQKNYKSALNEINKYLKFKKNDAGGLILRADLNIIAGDIEAAKKDLISAIKIKPNSQRSIQANNILESIQTNEFYQEGYNKVH